MSKKDGGEELSEYEKQRLANIERNNAVMASLGLKDATKNKKAAGGGG